MNQNTNTQKIGGIKYCIFLFQLSVIANNVLGSSPDLYTISKGVMLLFMGSVIMLILANHNAIIRKSISLTSLILFMTTTAASCLWSPYSDVAFTQLVTQVQMYIMFFFVVILFNYRLCIKEYLNALLVSGIGLAVYSMYRYGMLGFMTQLQSGQRMGGMIANENVYGLVFSQAAIIAIGYMLYEIKTSKRIIYIALAVLFSFFALSSGSKKAVLMIGMGVILICIMRYGFRRIYKTLIIIVIAIIALYTALNMDMFTTVNERLFEYFNGRRNASDQIRQNAIQVGLKLFANRPFFGSGMQSFSRLSGLGIYAHNNFIEILVSTGLFGFVLYYIPFVAFITKGIKLIKDTGKNMCVLLLWVLVALSVIFDYGMVQYYDKSCWLLFAIMISVLGRKEILENEE